MKILFILISTIGYVGAQFVCPTDWLPSEDRCYQFNFSPLRTYDNAIAHCQDNGAILLSIETRAEYTFISTRLQSTDQLRHVWYTSGQRDSSRTNRYVWTSTNTQVNLDFITLKDPNDDREKDILAFTFDSQYQQFSIEAVSDRTVKRPFICEISRNEVYRINVQNRGFDYGVPFSNMNDVKRGPSFIAEASSTVVISDKADYRMFMECLAAGIPQPDYEWFRNNSGRITKITSNLDSRYTITNGKLTIDNPEDLLDAGMYFCKVTNSEGTIISAPAQLSFAYLGDFNNRQTDQVRPPEYQGAVVECPDIVSTFSQAVTYQWKKSETDHWLSSKIDIRPELNKHLFISGNGRLYFSEVTDADNAYYYCIATMTTLNINQNVIQTQSIPSRTSRPTYLNVTHSGSGNYDPVIQDSFINVVPGTPVVGMNVTLECFAYGTMKLNYYWDIPRWVSNRFELTDNSRMLKIQNVQLDDTGRYNCRVENSRNTGKFDEKNYTLYVESQPFFVMPLQNQHLDVGTRQLTWRCEARAIPFPVYTWYKDGELLQNESDPDITIHTNTLYLRNLDPTRDSGMYQCMAENSHGRASSTAQLRILSFAPSFEKNPMSSTMSGAVGGDVIIQCRPEAAPFPDIIWLHNGGNMNPSDDSGARVYMTTEGDLVITQISSGDQGRYECRAENTLGSDTNSTILSIMQQTTIYQSPGPQTVSVNQTAVFTCQASFNRNSLDIMYQWMFNGRIIDTEKSEHHNVGTTNTDGGRLYITYTQYDHAGVYTCLATTQIDSASASASLQVVGPPTQPAGLEVYTANDQLANGQNYGSSDVVLRWTDPTDNHGADLTHYIIYGRTNYSTQWSVLQSYIPQVNTIISGSGDLIDSYRRQFLLTELKPGVSYQFKVRAINLYGVGDESKPSVYASIPGAAPMRYPSNIGGGGGSVGTLRLTWDPLPLEDVAGPGIRYIVEYRRKPADELSGTNIKWNTVTVYGNVGEVSDEVGGDNYYLEYQVQVTAVNNIGAGPAGRNDTVMSAEAMPNGIPSNAYAEPFNESAIIVHWDPVADTREMVKGKLKGYKILYWLKDIEDHTVALQSIVYGNKMEGTIIGLRPDTWYSFVVVVFNGAGNGVKGEVTHQSTDRSAPLHYPVHISIYPHSSTSVRVRFRGVSTGVFEEPLLGYKIRFWEDSNDIRNAIDVDLERNTEGIIHQVQSQTLYHLRVLGYSVGGDGKMSSPETLFSFMRDRVSQVMIDPSTSEVAYVLHDYDPGNSAPTLSVITSAVLSLLCALYIHLF